MIDMPKCYHCKRDTITFKERYSDLIGKCETYKKKKVSRAERKTKWDLWKKTQAMLRKRNSINYQKWDLYTSESSEEEPKTDPIVPENDPTFKAMEKDINDRAEKRKKDKKIADSYKQKGN